MQPLDGVDFPLYAVIGLALSMTVALLGTRRSVRALRRHVARLQAANDAERGRLSHELHDDVGQKLIALKLQLQLARLPGAAGDDTHETSLALLDTVIGEVRALSHVLRPAPFDEGQLIPALTALAKAEGRRSGLCVLVDAPDDDVRLPREVELTCYRVVREAFNNIVKHARARHVAVSVRRIADAFAVTVADDGRGFDVSPGTRSAVLGGRLGLVGMQERLSQVGGTLTIRSQRGAGTSVECRVPLQVMA